MARRRSQRTRPDSDGLRPGSATSGTAGSVLANGSMSFNQSGEGAIRRDLIEGELVDFIIALPGQVFYSTQIPACLWSLARDRKTESPHNVKAAARLGRLHDRCGEILFIDTRKLGRMASRAHREFSDGDIDRIAGTCHTWRIANDPFLVLV